MKTYKIEVVRITRDFDIVEVKAQCLQEAKELAKKLAKEKGSWDELQKPSYQTEIIND